MNDTMNVSPQDSYNKKLLQNTHPEDWVNPEPASCYNLVVIGAGTAGLVSAAGAAGLGAKVALVEKNFMGGDCLNFGCVPSKAIIRSSRVIAELNTAKQYGIDIQSDVKADFPRVMERMRQLRAGISDHDSALRFRDELDIDVFLGEGKFTGPHTVEVNGATLNFKKAVIATGARPVIPSVEGLNEAGFLTNETVFSLTERPEHILVIGGGPIGCELSQAFRRLGCEVTIIVRGSQFLSREDPDAAAIVAQTFEREGIQVVLDAAVKKVSVSNNKKCVHVERNGETVTFDANEILVGAGRAPNVEHLNLDVAGVTFDSRKGVIVNDKLQTANHDIYAAGDVCMQHKFTHTADFAARIVIQNALFMGRSKLSALTVPWCTYTDPEIAHVGMYERVAQTAGIAVETYVRHLHDVDRAILDGEDEGFVKVLVKKGTDTIIGGTIVARHAGEMISELTLAITGNIGLKKLSGVIHPYPTQAEAIRQIGDMYSRTRLTPFLKKVFHKWFAWSRR